jgi:putative redox protein
LLLAGAGACAAWDVVEILRKRRAAVQALDVTVQGEQQDEPPWTYTRVALHFRVRCDRLTVPVLQRVVRLSVVRYCSVITTIAAAAAIEATVELVTSDGQTSGARMVELAIPSVVVQAVDLPVVDVTEPVADEGG